MISPLIFSEEHHRFRDRLKRFLEKEITPHINKWEQEGSVPRTAWQKLGQAGFLCPWIPKAYGGSGADFLYSLVINEELARTNHGGLMVYLHSDIIAPYIHTFGSEQQKQAYLPGCVRGDIILAVAMTEPDVGSDLASSTTAAVEEGGRVVINGTKTFISNGLNCGLAIVAARDPAIENPYRALSLYLVEEGTPGFEKGQGLKKMGLRSQDTAELYFRDCRIPVSQRLGEKGNGFQMLMQKLQQERLMVALQALYMSEFSVDWLLNQTEEAVGIQDSQVFQFTVAEMVTENRIARVFLEQLVASHMKGMEVSTETSMAKFWVTDLLKRTTGRVLDFSGEYATLEECPTQRTWRDAQVYPIFAGTNEIMKSIIARKLFRQ